MDYFCFYLSLSIIFEDDEDLLMNDATARVVNM